MSSGGDGTLLQNWKPYAGSAVPGAVMLRWMLLNPLQFVIPYLRFTIGELLVLGASVAYFMSRGAGGGGGGEGEDEDRRRLEEEGGEGSGNLAVTAFALCFVTATHNSIFTFIFGLPFERALFWHKYFAIWAVILSFWHAQDVEGDRRRRLEEEEGESSSGWFATYVACIMLAFLIEPIRRHAFELFYRLHWILFMMVIFALLAHGAGGIMFGVLFWIADIAIRYIWMACLNHGQNATIEMLPADVIKVTIPRGNFNYRAGQYCFLCIPELSMFEWHPFSISTSPYSDGGYITLHVRVLGDWTGALKKLASKKKDVSILFEGPYGEPQVDIEGDKYQMFLLISGGIGITPMQSICNQLLDEHARGRPLELCYFVWSCRDKEMVESVLPTPAVPMASAVVVDGDENSSQATAGAAAEPETGGNRSLPMSFQPNLLKKYSVSPTVAKHVEQARKSESNRSDGVLDSDEVVHTEFYLTKARNEADLENTGIRENAKPVLRFGRPNIEELFTTMRSIAIEKGIKRVAVLTCGPSGLVSSVITQAQAHTTYCDGVQFDVHNETFAF